MKLISVAFINIQRIWFGILLWLCSEALFALDNERLIDAINEEIRSLELTYQLQIANVVERNALAARYHHALLAADGELLVLRLTPNERLSLLHSNYPLQPAHRYREKRRNQLNQSLASLVATPVIANVSQRVVVGEPMSSLNNLSLENAAVAINGIPGFECYPTVEETEAIAFDLESRFPNFSEMIDIGDSWEKVASSGAQGYDLWVMKITNKSVVKEKPVLFIHSAMHAREYTTAALTLDFAKMLLEGYSSNADIEWVVDHHEVHILFHMNPDGRKIAEAGVLKRKNTNTNHCATNVTATGVDLNRNFSFFWDVGGFDPNYRFVSSNECSDTYRGPAPASEPETQAVESYVSALFVDERGQADADAAPDDKSGLHLDIHSFGNLLLYPYAHTRSEAPNGTALRSLARRLSYFNNYFPQQTPGLYLLDGASDGASYGELGVAQLTYELGSTFFQSCSSYGDTIKPDNLKSLLHAAKLTAAPYRLPAGPYFETFKIKGREHPDITQGTDISITAVVSDELFNQLNGVEAGNTISAIEYSMGQHFYNMAAVPVQVNPVLHIEDGVYDEVKETLNLTLSNSANEYPLGRHTIYLRAIDSAGNVGAIAARHFTIISDAYLEANITADCRFNLCEFNATGSIDTDGEIIGFRWDMGDGTILLGDVVNHFYTSNNNYTVSLIVEGQDGELDTASYDVAINLPGQIPEFAYQVSCDGLTCAFDSGASSDPSGGSLRHIWNLPGQVIRQSQFSYTFPEPGEYQVTGYIVNDDRWLNGEEVDLTVEARAPIEEHEVEQDASGGGGAMFWLLLPLALSVTCRYVLCIDRPVRAR